MKGSMEMCRICGCPEERWLRVSTVARQFRCSSKKVRRMLKCGELDGVRLGGEWRVDHRSLDDYVRKDSVRFAEPPAEPRPV
jgi:excisionase family DNA binding protein